MTRDIKIGDIVEYVTTKYMNDPDIKCGDTVVVTDIIWGSDKSPMFIEHRTLDGVVVMRRAYYYRLPIKTIRKEKLQEIDEHKV